MVFTRHQRDLLQRFPLHAALLYDDGALECPANPQQFSGPGGFSAMHAAALMNKPAAIASLAAAGCDVNTAMQEELRSCPGSHELHQLLQPLLADREQDVRACNILCLGSTPLSVAVMSRNVEAVAALLAAGAPAEQQLPHCYGEKRTLLALCVDTFSQDATHITSISDPASLQAIVGMLLAAGADCCKHCSDGFFGHTYALSIAVRCRSPAVVPMLHHLSQQLQECQRSGGDSRGNDTGSRSQHPLLEQQEEAEMAACAAVQQHDAAAALFFLELSRKATSRYYRYGCEPFYMLLSEAVREGLPEVVQPALQLISARGRKVARQGKLPLVAAARGHTAVLQALLQEEEVHWWHSLHNRAEVLEEAIDTCQPAGVQLALFSGAGPAKLVRRYQRPSGHRSREDPLVRLLYAAETQFLRSPADAEDLEPATMQEGAAAIAELLLSAGFHPAAAAAEFREIRPSVHTRLMALALERPAWRPVCHPCFPARFRDAVRTLLLAAHRLARTSSSSSSGSSCDRLQHSTSRGQQGASGSSSSGSSSDCCATWGDLPEEVVSKIIGMAAYPLLPWLAFD